MIIWFSQSKTNQDNCNQPSFTSRLLKGCTVVRSVVRWQKLAWLYHYLKKLSHSRYRIYTVHYVRLTSVPALCCYRWSQMTGCDWSNYVRRMNDKRLASTEHVIQWERRRHRDTWFSSGRGSELLPRWFCLTLSAKVSQVRKAKFYRIKQSAKVQSSLLFNYWYPLVTPVTPCLSLFSWMLPQTLLFSCLM